MSAPTKTPPKCAVSPKPAAGGFLNTCACSHETWHVTRSDAERAAVVHLAAAAKKETR